MYEQVITMGLNVLLSLLGDTHCVIHRYNMWHIKMTRYDILRTSTFKWWIPGFIKRPVFARKLFLSVLVISVHISSNHFKIIVFSMENEFEYYELHRTLLRNKHSCSEAPWMDHLYLFRCNLSETIPKGALSNWFVKWIRVS